MFVCVYVCVLVAKGIAVGIKREHRNVIFRRKRKDSFSEIRSVENIRLYTLTYTSSW